VPALLIDLSRIELLEAMNCGWSGRDRTAASMLQEERAGVPLRLGNS
jgi:hypothetical protein